MDLFGNPEPALRGPVRVATNLPLGLAPGLAGELGNLAEKIERLRRTERLHAGTGRAAKATRERLELERERFALRAAVSGAGMSLEEVATGARLAALVE